MTSVGATNWSGGLAATEHLLSLGHRRIAFAGGPLPASCSQARLHGFRAALENAGYTADPDLVLHGDFEYPGGLTTVRQPLQDMGRVALRTLPRLIAGETLDSYHVELATNLVVRGSTAAIADQGAR